MSEEYDDSLTELIEIEKKNMDDKIDKSKYAYFVIKCNYYKELIEVLRIFNSHVKGGISESHEKLGQVIECDFNEEFLSKSIIDMLSHCLKVDSEPMVLEDKHLKSK